MRGVSIKELVSRFGIDRNTVRRALRPAVPTHAMSARELIEPLGFEGSKAIVDNYLREVRPLFLPRRTFQRKVYRPRGRSASSICGSHPRRCR